MLKTIQHIKGHMRVTVSGFNVARFLNMAAYRGVYIWDVVKAPAGNKIELSVSNQGYPLLAHCASKTNCHTEITQQTGLPFTLARYKGRKLLMAGILFFILGLYGLSSFIWHIEIVGNDMIETQAVMAHLESEGLRVGAFKHRLTDRNIRDSLLNNFTQISWADVHTRGTRTHIELTEILPAKEILAFTTPTHVVAAEEGLITQVITWSGAPMVKAGDIVQPGDRLVNGILELVPDDPATPLVYVHAQAEVWAKQYHHNQFFVPFQYQAKVYTGESTKSRRLSFLFMSNWGFRLPGGGHTFASYDKITIYTQPWVESNYPWPIIMATTYYNQFNWQDFTRDTAQAKLEAENILTNWIIAEFDFATDIIHRQLDFYETPDGLQVTATLTTHRRIDQQIPVYRDVQDT